MPLIATMLVFSGEGDLEVPESIHTSRPTERFFSKTPDPPLISRFCMCVLCVVLLACRKSCPSLLLAKWHFTRRMSAIFCQKFHTDAVSMNFVILNEYVKYVKSA